MKKTVLLCFASLIFISAILSYSVGILCSSDNSMCSAGYNSLYGHNVYANNGIMYSSEMMMCSNGFTVLRTEDVKKKQKRQ